MKPVLAWECADTRVTCGDSWLQISGDGETLLRLRGRRDLDCFTGVVAELLASIGLDQETVLPFGELFLIYRNGEVLFNHRSGPQHYPFDTDDLRDVARWLHHLQGKAPACCDSLDNLVVTADGIGVAGSDIAPLDPGQMAELQELLLQLAESGDEPWTRQRQDVGGGSVALNHADPPWFTMLLWTTTEPQRLSRSSLAILADRIGAQLAPAA